MTNLTDLAARLESGAPLTNDERDAVAAALRDLHARLEADKRRGRKRSPDDAVSKKALYMRRRRMPRQEYICNPCDDAHGESCEASCEKEREHRGTIFVCICSHGRPAKQI